MRNYSLEDWKYHIKDWVTHKALFITNFSKITPSISKSLLTDSNSNNDQMMYKTGEIQNFTRPLCKNIHISRRKLQI